MSIFVMKECLKKGCTSKILVCDFVISQGEFPDQEGTINFKIKHRPGILSGRCSLFSNYCIDISRRDTFPSKPLPA